MSGRANPGVGFTLELRTLSTPPRFLTSSDTRLSMAPSMECSAPGKAENMGQGLAGAAAHTGAQGETGGWWGSQ